MMREFKLNKLVHDGIIGLNEEHGAITDYIELTGDNLVDALFDKLDEEIREFEQAITTEEMLKEFRDVRCVFFAIRKAMGREVIDDGYVPEKTFDRGFFVRSVMEPEGEWADYYASNPERFPEISSP